MGAALDPHYWSLIAFMVAVVAVIIIGAIAATVCIKISVGKIDISKLLDDGTGLASFSRFQFLIFTFVIAGLYLALCLESGTLLEVPPTTLALLGISGTSYVAAKAISELSSDNSTSGSGKSNSNTTRTTPIPRTPISLPRQTPVLAPQRKTPAGNRQ